MATFNRQLALVLALASLPACRTAKARVQSPVSIAVSSIDGWVDLGPGMLIKIEQAYFNPPESRSIKDYIGLESAHYRYQANQSLRLLDQSTLPSRPRKQPAAAAILPAAQLRARHHRLIFQVALDKKTGAARAVLLSAGSQAVIASRYEALRRTGICTTQCTAIPEAASASLLIELTANGQPLTVPWGTTPANLAGQKRPTQLLRQGVSIDIDAALRRPLMPGDELTY